jgi:hypothetical protein
MIGDLRTLDDLAVSEHHVAVDEGWEAVGLNASAIDVDPLELLGGAEQLGRDHAECSVRVGRLRERFVGLHGEEGHVGSGSLHSEIHPTPGSGAAGIASDISG